MTRRALIPHLSLPPTSIGVYVWWMCARDVELCTKPQTGILKEAIDVSYYPRGLRIKPYTSYTVIGIALCTFFHNHI